MQFALIAIFGVVFVLDRGETLGLAPAVTAAGWVACGAGIAIGAAALAAMGRVMRVSPEPKPGGHLVTRGVYRKLRHPMYTGVMLVAFGLWLRKPSLAVAIVGAALIALMLAKARYEERLLAARYPDYAAYRERSWGVIPGIR
jgi:protein-S-isoprenylcysteine O-methyltransferase Ste14